MDLTVVTLSTPTCLRITNVMQGSEPIIDCVFCIVGTNHSVVSIVGVNNTSLCLTSDVVCRFDKVANFLVYSATIAHRICNFKVVKMIGWNSHGAT